MAARLAPNNVARMHQSLHHVVADAPWGDEAMLRQVRDAVLPAMQKHGPVVCWIVDDTGFPKKGSHSVGVARQYCGQVGNCRVAVSLSVATWASSLPIAYWLYLPEVWASDKKRRKAAGIPEDVAFQRKPQIALDQIRDDRDHQPVTVKQLALSLPSESWKTVTWRQGTRYKLRSRFAALRVRPAHRDYWKAEP